MNITFVTPYPGMSGGIRVVAIYAERLQRRGHRVTVVSTGRRRPRLRQRVRAALRGELRNPRRDFQPSHFDGLDVPHVRLPHAGPLTDADVPDADVIVATWWETAEWVARLASCKGAKAYFVQHHETFDYLPQGRVEATWRLPLHKIVIADWLADLARDRYGDRHVSLVPNSVDTRQFQAPPRGKQARPTVGLLYTLAPWKGCDLSLAAVALARRSLPDLRLIAFGNQPSATHLPLPEGTRYVQQPPQELLKELYASCDAWLCASRVEGFGLPLLEAMACRTPVIATPAGAAPRLLADGGGQLVPAEDPPALAAAIEHLTTLTDAAWRAVSTRAYRTATRYTWDDATDRFEAALALARSRAPCPSRLTNA